MAPPNHLKFDLENGETNKERGASMAGGEDDFDGGAVGGGNDEYSNLIRYISTYRDGRRKSTISLGSKAEDMQDEKVPGWKFWARKPKSQSSGDDTFQAPEEWMNTQLREGLTEGEVENRRKKAGWNELTTEKENMFLKFLGYFQGPILYGQSFPHSLLCPSPLTRRSHGNRRPHLRRSP